MNHRLILILTCLLECLGLIDNRGSVRWLIIRNSTRDVVRIALLSQVNESSTSCLCVRVMVGTKHEEDILRDEYCFRRCLCDIYCTFVVSNFISIPDICTPFWFDSSIVCLDRIII